MKQFREILDEKKTSKKLIRLIEDKLLCFGPKRKGPNLLINKFMNSEESMIQIIYKLAREHLELSENDLLIVSNNGDGLIEHEN